MKGDDLADRLLNFAVRVLKILEALPKTVAGKHIDGQLVRSGTSAGAKNYEEGRDAESRGDFLPKLGICWKEIRASWYWLRLIHKAQLI